MVISNQQEENTLLLFQNLKFLKGENEEFSNVQIQQPLPYSNVENRQHSHFRQRPYNPGSLPNVNGRDHSNIAAPRQNPCGAMINQASNFA
uniref:Uncharacterized protein n=1 Tax=Panagrolaimus sp. ES5 TaxID=591445 RepID=A0AC34G7E0_9BILA